MNLETKITIYKFTPQLFTLTPGMLMPSCSHFTYNNLIINILHGYSKNICFHLCPHTLTIF